MKIRHRHVLTTVYNTDEPRGAVQAMSQAKHQSFVGTSDNKTSSSHAQDATTWELIYSAFTNTRPVIGVPPQTAYVTTPN